MPKGKKRDDFVHFHLHTDFSQLDGCGKIGDYVKEVAKRGSPAIAVTDHGTMRGCYHLQEQCEEHGVKPVHGIEFYIANDMRRKGLMPEEKAEITNGLKPAEKKAAIRQYEEQHGIRDRWHLTVWAQNDIGLKNLFRLSSAAFTEGFYYKPRIDLAELMKYGEGLAVATGCMSSSVNDLVIGGNRRRALEQAEMLRECFGEHLWIEVQPHPLEDQVVVNRFALELKERWGKHARLLACQDAHYVHQSDAPHHEVLLCIGTNDSMKNPHRFKFDGGPEFYLKTRKQMWRSFMDHHGYMGKGLIKEALDSTMVLSEMITAKLNVDYHAALLPEIDMPSQFTTEWDYLVHLCLKGWRWRRIDDRAMAIAKSRGRHSAGVLKEYRGRFRHEMGALKRQKFVPYFLMVCDIYNWARGAGIMCGPGRGSVAGSLVAYLLGLTSIDPIEHGLIFERFINPNRVDMPDVDMDFEDQRRGEIIQYLRGKYGEERVAQIATVSRLTGKQCLKDVSRVYDVPYAEVNAVTNAIAEKSSGDERASQTVHDAFKQVKICRIFDKKYPFVLEHAEVLEGMAKNLGVHAAGVVVAPGPLTDYVPLEIRKQPAGDVVVTAVDMHGVAASGLVKLDVLGLRTLTVLREAVEKIEERHGVKIDLEDLPLNDKAVLKLFTEHDYCGIFQYDTPGADKICAGVEFENFTDVAAMTALNRPGTARSGLSSTYVALKNDPNAKIPKDHVMHPRVAEICSDTYGVIVYQEHVIKIFGELAGFAPGTADSLRKAIAKKKGDETIGKERDNFVKGAAKTSGLSKKEAESVFEKIKFFGCLASDTELVVPSGLARIDSLKPGDEVLSYDDGELIPNSIKAIGCTGKKQAFRMVTGMGETVATAEHWFMCADGEYRKLVDLRVGDKLFYPTGLNPVGGKNENLFDGRLQKADVGKGAQRVRKVPSRARTESPSAEQTGSSRPSQGPEQTEQLHGKFGSALFELPSKGTRSGTAFGEETTIKAIEPVGEVETWDLETTQKPNNYLTESNVNHNSYGFNKSHATAYGVIAYWGMWLKHYYPVEFYWALMKCEPQRIRVQHIAGDAKSKGIHLLPPHVSVSGEDFAIDLNGAIRGSLVDVKSVGGAAAKAIIEGQPYKGLIDFVRRVDRRKCHRGVVVALMKAGALDDFLPNVKWAIENIDEWWKLVGRGKWKEIVQLLVKSKSEPQYNDEDRQMIASSVNPLAFGKHPITAYMPFVEECLKVDIRSMGDEDFFKAHNWKHVFICGIIVEIKYNQIGDFHQGAIPSEQEQAKMFWGARYANVNIEDESGTQNRVKFDIDIFDTFRPIVDKGIGTPVVVYAMANAKTETLKASFAVDLELLRTKVRNGEPTDVWENMLIGKHPAITHPWGHKKKKVKRIIENTQFKASEHGGPFCGVVTGVRQRYDKRGGLMANVGIRGFDMFVDVFFFSSYWTDEVKEVLKPGNLVEVAVQKGVWRGRTSLSYSGGGIRLAGGELVMPDEK